MEPLPFWIRHGNWLWMASAMPLMFLGAYIGSVIAHNYYTTWDSIIGQAIGFLLGTLAFEIPFWRWFRRNP